MPETIWKKYQKLKEIGPKDLNIKTYLAGIELIVKEIKPKDNDDYILISQRLEELKKRIKIFDIIEENDNIYIVLDKNEELNHKVDGLLFSEELDNEKEGIIEGHGSPIKKDEILELFKMEKSMCKIECTNKEGEKIQGSGFFCKLNDNKISFKYALFTNNHILDESSICVGKTIKFECFELQKSYFFGSSYNLIKKEIKITDERKVYTNTNKDLDYTCIQLFESDGIIDFFELEPDLFKYDHKEILKNNDIFILQFPKGKDISFSHGIIKILKDNIIIHNASTEGGSSGSPIIRRSNKNYVIGLHSSGKKKKEKKKYSYNLAINFVSILDDIKKKEKYIADKEKENKEINSNIVGLDYEKIYRLKEKLDILNNSYDEAKDEESKYKILKKCIEVHEEFIKYYYNANNNTIDKKYYIYVKLMMNSCVKLLNMKNYITEEETVNVINIIKEYIVKFILKSENPDYLDNLADVFKNWKFENDKKVNIQYGEFCGEKKNGETQTIRNPNTAKGELRQVMHLGINNMWDAFENNLKVGRAKKNFVGFRKKKNKNGFEDKYTWITYEEAHIKILNFCRGLNILKLCPLHEIENDDSFRFLGIYSKNRPEWLLSYFGAVRDSITIVPIYDSLSNIKLEYIFKQTKLITLVIESKCLEKFLGWAKNGKIGEIKNLIVLDADEDEKSCKELAKLGLNIYTWDKVTKDGEEKGQNMEFHSPGPETISTISYTSGSLGYPKGAKISHNSILLNTDVIEMIGLYLKEESDIYLSFLPLAHIMETLAMAVLVSRGIPIGFYSEDTKKLFEDAKILCPTCMCGVPIIFNRIYECIFDLFKQKFMYKKLISIAIDLKMKDNSEKGKLTSLLWDDLIFKKIRDILGGRMRFILIGSAPIDAYILKFLRCAFSCEIVEGYGQTEDSAGVLLTKTFDLVTGHLGGPGYSAELKLIDVPELDYTSTDVDPETGKWRPRGELCIRGPILFKGYLSLKEETKKILDENGWLHTGDIAMIQPEHGNSFKIIDRLEYMINIFPSVYISPETLEKKLAKCKYIDQIFIYGEFLNIIVGIIVPKTEDVIEYLKRKGIKNATKENYKDYYEDQDLIKDILKEIHNFSKLNGFNQFETVNKVYLSKERFTVENNLITPTMKIKRRNAKKYFLKEINKMYGK